MIEPSIYKKIKVIIELIIAAVLALFCVLGFAYSWFINKNLGQMVCFVVLFFVVCHFLDD